MIKVKVGTNHGVNEVVVAKTTTVREVLEQQNLNYVNSQVYLGTKVLVGQELDKTFEDYGVEETVILTCTEKAISG